MKAQSVINSMHFTRNCQDPLPCFLGFLLDREFWLSIQTKTEEIAISFCRSRILWLRLKLGHSVSYFGFSRRIVIQLSTHDRMRHIRVYDPSLSYFFLSLALNVAP